MPRRSIAPLRVLVCRNDKLGDFMLAWPAFALLRAALPQAELVALVPEYTSSIARLCGSLDGVLIDKRGSTIELARAVSERHCDAAIAFFSDFRLGFALAAARIAHRVAPATKLAQVFYNHRLIQRRSRSENPEFIYNLELARHALSRYGVTDVPTPSPPYLEFPGDELTAHRQALTARLGLPAAARWVFLHPGSGGSAATLKPKQYIQLGKHLAKHRGGLAFVITAGPGEENVAASVAAGLSPHPAAVLMPEDLPGLARSIALADLFISGSTGPLHIAGALNRPTAAFYPGHRSGSALRWQTLSSDDRRLAFSPPDGGDPKQVSRIDLEDAAAAIDALLSRMDGRLPP